MSVPGHHMNIKRCISISSLRFAVFILGLLMVTSCSENEMAHNTLNETYLQKIPVKVWGQLGQKRIYFGHQSVGDNIIEGMRELMVENSRIRLNIVAINDDDQLQTGAFGHASIGQNGKPLEKMQDFAANLYEGIGQKVDLAGMKLCYLDINSGSDPTVLFDHYKSMVAEVRNKFPNLTIIHFTAPLVKRQSGIKALIKKIIGKPLTGIDDNIKRNEYNDLLRNEYEGSNALFDIARIESTYPDGRRSSFDKKGKTYYSLIPQYTYDDGHLNDSGRKTVAANLLIFLAGL